MMLSPSSDMPPAFRAIACASDALAATVLMDTVISSIDAAIADVELDWLDEPCATRSAAVFNNFTASPTLSTCCAIVRKALWNFSNVIEGTRDLADFVPGIIV